MQTTAVYRNRVDRSFLFFRAAARRLGGADTENYPTRGLQRPPSIIMEEYEPIKVLGEGSFGKVYLMKHSQTRDLVCTKVMMTYMYNKVTTGNCDRFGLYYCAVKQSCTC